MEFESGPIVEAENLEKVFGDLTAVKDVSFRLRKGECLGLLGPNGAGKTSTVRMLYGFSPFTSGKLRVFGIELPAGWRSVRYRFGVCRQENDLDPDLTVIQNLELYAGYFDIPRKEARERAGKLLEFIALESRKNDPVASLSGGMMRRVVLARALLNDPELLLLDEPTTGLDPQSRHLLWDRLEKLRAGGLSILLTTHYMEEASQLCDRLIIMDHGRILVDGTPAGLIAEHVGKEVVEVPRPGNELLSFVRESGLRCDSPDRKLIVYGGEGEEGFIHTIVERYCRGQCIRRMSTLEDVFLRLTGRELRE